MMHNDVALERQDVLAGARDERAWYILAHLSVFVNLVTGFLGPVVALVLRFTRGRRSRGVGRHAVRSFWNQVVWLLLVAPVGSIFTFSLTLLLPVPEAFLLLTVVAIAAAWFAVPFAEGAWAAYRSSRGHDYRYLLDRLTSFGDGKSRRGKKRSHVALFDDDSEDEDDDFDLSDDDYDSSGDYGSSGDSDWGGDSGGFDFGGDSGSW